MSPAPEVPLADLWPEPDRLSAPFWEAAATEKLVLPYCPSCDRYFFRPELACPECHQTDWEWISASGRGTIHTYTIVHRSPMPFIEAPFVLAVVELDEGVHMLTNVVGQSLDDARSMMAGTPVEVRFRHIDDEHTLPEFVVTHPMEGQ